MSFVNFLYINSFRWHWVVPIVHRHLKLGTEWEHGKGPLKPPSMWYRDLPISVSDRERGVEVNSEWNKVVLPFHGHLK